MSALAHHIGLPAPARAEGDLARAALITQLVAYATGVSAGEIAGSGRRAAPVSRARQMAMYLAHTVLSWSLARVGQAFGRDRTTAGHACLRVEDWRDDAGFDEVMSQLEACLQAAPSPDLADRGAWL